jgi:hypothetical protein
VKEDRRVEGFTLSLRAVIMRNVDGGKGGNDENGRLWLVLMRLSTLSGQRRYLGSEAKSRDLT